MFMIFECLATFWLSNSVLYLSFLLYLCAKFYFHIRIIFYVCRYYMNRQSSSSWCLHPCSFRSFAITVLIFFSFRNHCLWPNLTPNPSQALHFRTQFVMFIWISSHDLSRPTKVLSHDGDDKTVLMRVFLWFLWFIHNVTATAYDRGWPVDRLLC